MWVACGNPSLLVQPESLLGHLVAIGVTRGFGAHKLLTTTLDIMTTTVVQMAVHTLEIAKSDQKKYGFRLRVPLPWPGMRESQTSPR